MFTKFKKGDTVMLLSDLTQVRSVVKAWTEKQWSDRWLGVSFLTEKVALNDNTVLNADQLTFYSKPLQLLAIQMEILKKEIEILKRQKKR